jgi:DNA-binding beta-propeller fold protein YncE
VGDIPHIRGKQFVRFPSLVGICFFPGNKMLFTDSYLNKIFVYNPDKKEIRTLNDSIILDQPTGIAYSEINHEIWVVETRAHYISVLDDKGRRKRTIGKRGVEPGEFNYPTSIWIDKTGKAYVIDALNFRVQIFSKDGDLISFFGENGDGGGNLARPKGIATDSYGNIYIVDALFNTVQIFDISGNFLHAFGSQGKDQGEFWMPSGIYVDDSNYIYVADSYNSRVQVFQFQNGDLK